MGWNTKQFKKKKIDLEEIPELSESRGKYMYKNVCVCVCITKSVPLNCKDR